MGVFEFCGLGLILISIHTPVSQYIKSNLFTLVAHYYTRGGPS